MQNGRAHQPDDATRPHPLASQTRPEPDFGKFPHMSVLVVGSMALDSVETPFGKRDDALGGSAVFFSIAASLLTDVRLVAVIGDDFPEKHVELLRGRRIDLAGVERIAGG